MKNKTVKILAAILIFASSFGIAVSVDGVNMDYSRPGSLYTDKLYAGEIIEDALGIDVSDEEKAYLEKYSDFSLTLPQSIASSYVTSEYDENNKSLSVKAQAYIYELSDGTRVEWIPTRANLFGKKQPLISDGEEYKTVFTDVEKFDDNTKNILYVDFEYGIVISDDAFNSFVNKAYNDIPALKEEHIKKSEAYAAALSKFENDRREYQKYLEALSEYNAKYSLYEKYLTDKKIYDEKYAAYLQYLKDLDKFKSDSVLYAQYEKDMQKYEADYISYLQYLSNADKYDKDMEKYQNYVKTITKVREQLKIIDQIKTQVGSLKRSIYSDITGTTVTSVIENKTLIVNHFGVSGAVVDLAGKSTENLRQLFSDYFSYTEEADKYAYYVVNYEKFRDNFANLLRALDKLYENEGVTDTMRSQEKEEKYVVLLAMLYKITNALSTETVYSYDGKVAFDKNYKIQNYYAKFEKDSFYNKYKVSKKPSDIIKDSGYCVDIADPVPISNGYPAEVKEPQLLVTTEPKKPDYMKKPVEPDEVFEPDKINEVKKPTPPKEVNEPQKPDEYVADSAVLGIIDDEFSISLRDTLKDDIILTKSISVKKQFIGAVTVSVSFHDVFGNEIFVSEVDRGTAVDFYGNLPTKEEDESATYSFECWVDGEGNPVDLRSPDRDMNLYPSFKKTLKQYEISFIIGDKAIKEKYDYGTLPSCPVYPSLDDTGSTYFVFDGFDCDILPVTRDAVYTALFTEKYFVSYEKGDGAKISYSADTCTVDASFSDDKVYDLSKILEKAAGKYALTLLTRHGDVSFSFSDTARLKNEGVKSIGFSTRLVGESAYEYEISLYGETGGKVENISANLNLPCKAPEPERLTLYFEEGENKKQVSYTLTNANIRFKATLGVKYFAQCEHSIIHIPCEVLTFTVDKKTANYGSTVFVSFIPVKGIEIRGTYYIGSSGEKVYFENYFTVSEDVSVGIDYEYTEYTVSFVSDGKIISTNTYHYGEMPVIPQSPKKPADDEYTYTFVGWSSKVNPVKSDAVYEAVYWSNPVIKEDAGPIQISNKILQVLLFGIAMAFIFVFGAVPCVILSIIFHKKRKRIYINSLKESVNPQK
jgi:hypothetical protein